jgi:hypothetical protein
LLCDPVDRQLDRHPARGLMVRCARWLESGSRVKVGSDPDSACVGVAVGALMDKALGSLLTGHLGWQTGGLQRFGW